MTMNIQVSDVILRNEIMQEKDEVQGVSPLRKMSQSNIDPYQIAYTVISCASIERKRLHIYSSRSPSCS